MLLFSMQRLVWVFYRWLSKLFRKLLFQVSLWSKTSWGYEALSLQSYLYITNFVLTCFKITNTRLYWCWGLKVLFLVIGAFIDNFRGRDYETRNLTVFNDIRHKNNRIIFIYRGICVTVIASHYPKIKNVVVFVKERVNFNI